MILTGSRQQPIPCRMPKVEVANVGRIRSPYWDAWRATCAVPGCDWAYENTEKTDVTETAVGHRRWHRDSVPGTRVTKVTHGYAVTCPCGFARNDGSTTTLTDSESVREHHLTHVHGLVRCS